MVYFDPHSKQFSICMRTSVRRPSCSTFYLLYLSIFVSSPRIIQPASTCHTVPITLRIQTCFIYILPNGIAFKCICAYGSRFKEEKKNILTAYGESHAKSNGLKHSLFFFNYSNSTEYCRNLSQIFPIFHCNWNIVTTFLSNIGKYFIFLYPWLFFV